MSTLVCDVCPRACKLEEGKTGFCKVRGSVGGKNVDALYSLVHPHLSPSRFGRVHLYLPGCNLRCWFCDVKSVARFFFGSDVYRKVTPSEAVDSAFGCGGQKLADFFGGHVGSGQLDFFGGEPGVHYEYVLETSRLLRERGGVSALYTCGYFNPWVMETLARAVDQVQIGIKGGATEEAYKPMGANPATVLHSVKIVYENCPDVWIRNLIGPYNSSLWPGDKALERFARWLVDNTNSKIPVLVEPMLEFTDTDEVPAIGRAPIGDDDYSMSIRCLLTGEIFVRNGLTNVWVFEALSGRVRTTHVPSGREFPEADALPKRR